MYLNLKNKTKSRLFLLFIFLKVLKEKYLFYILQRKNFKREAIS